MQANNGSLQIFLNFTINIQVVGLDASVVPASHTPSSGNNNQLGLTL